MKVGVALQSPKFIGGTHAIEYWVRYPGQRNPDDAYYLCQVAYANDGSPMCIERHRDFNSKVSDPYPRWVVIRGSGITRTTKDSAGGFYGLWLPHFSDLVADCKLVPLKKNDRVKDARVVKEKQWWER
jgi:hypothetical protein